MKRISTFTFHTRVIFNVFLDLIIWIHCFCLNKFTLKYTWYTDVEINIMVKCWNYLYILLNKLSLLFFWTPQWMLCGFHTLSLPYPKAKGRLREPGNLALRHFFLIKTFPFPFYSWSENIKQHNSLLCYIKAKNIKGF